MDTLIKRIIHLTQSNPDKMAAAFKKERLTYSELADKIINIGTRLALMGVKRGDRVLFTAVSKPEMIAAYLGIQYCGAVAVFIDKNTTPENAKAVYEDAEAVLYLTDKPMKGCENVKAVSFENSVINSDDKNTLNIASLKQIYMTQVSEKAEYTEPGEGDMAELLFTTGTTGKPLRARILNRNCPISVPCVLFCHPSKNLLRNRVSIILQVSTCTYILQRITEKNRKADKGRETPVGPRLWVSVQSV